MSLNNLLLHEETTSRYKEIINETVESINSSLSEKAYSGLSPEELRKAVKVEDLFPDNGLGFKKTLEITRDKVMKNLLNPFSKNYMAHLHSPAIMESIASELIIATFNQSMDSWDQSPAATEIEVNVITKLCSLFGFKQGDGVFTSGGTQSNLMGLLMARDIYCKKKLNHNVQEKGLPSQFSKFKIYTSQFSHFSAERSAHLLGLGYSSIVMIEADSQLKMDPIKLKDAINKDIKNGDIPMAVFATIGTTDFGSIDPLKEISQLCVENNLWLHGDAAYGSGLILSEKFKNRIENIHLCDSLTVDFHKMFLLPISCGAFILNDKKNYQVLNFHSDYLNRKEDEDEGYTNLVGKSLQTTRRFDALKVWMIFQSLGAKKCSKIITQNIENAHYIYKYLKNNKNFETISPPEISSVVFRVKGSCQRNKHIRRQLMHDHGIIIGQTIYKGKTYLKLTLLNPRIKQKDLIELIELIFQLKEVLVSSEDLQ